MTVSKVPYFSWSESGINSNLAPFNSCSPNLLSIQSYCQRKWPGVASLGCHVPPPASTKSHPYGAANDLRFPSRKATLEAIDLLLIPFSAELGVNTIHDYFDHQRMWKPNVGWIYNAPIGSPGGDWIHVETTPAAFLDGRPVEDKLPGSGQGEDPMTPQDQAYIDAKFAAATAEINQVAAEVWAQVLTLDNSARADVWLTEARKLSAASAAGVAALNEKVDKLAVGGIDLVALAELVRAQVRAELDATRFTGDR